jgi:cardiolipin synthase
MSRLKPRPARDFQLARIPNAALLAYVLVCERIHLSGSMGAPVSRQVYRESFVPLREFATRAFSRAAGAPLVTGNKLTLLKDATENYPAWLQAIAAARRTIHFETYIIHEDDAGRDFAEALAEKARQGVRVRLIYDWMGSLGRASRRFWKRLAASGVEVRCFNPPRADSALGWLRRDHRKMLCVDGQIGFVTGLCVGQRWVGDPAKGIQPWRDTGVAIEGPAVADLETAFAHMWALLGKPVSDVELAAAETPAPAGDVALRIVASYPNMAGLYRFDQLMSALAERSIWIADAYFLGTAPYIKALGAAAMDGVDVRLLLPNASDVPLVRSLSRAGYRELLEAGVRVFEWNGPMMHAKTAVADGRWARVGSTNMNLASWLGNWELDVVAEDEAFAEKMERMYLHDLEGSTEIVLSAKKVMPLAPQPMRRRSDGSGSARRAVTSVMRVSNTLGAAITSRRALGPSEVVVMTWAAVLLLALAAVAILWPIAVIVPLVLLSVWVAVSLLVRAGRLYRARKAKLKESGEAADAAGRI